MPNSFEFEGIEEQIRFFESLGRDVEKAENDALKAGGEEIAKHQKQFVNRSGKNQPHMQDNISVSKPKENDEGKYVEVGPNNKVKWRSIFLEYGTSKMSPRPFIDKGADSGTNDAVKAMEKVFLRAMNK